MTTLPKENLDERIERIKRRNEEIEKKYREAEEDRLMALKDNAMVEMKPPKDEDWPKAHKYDKIDFTYDVKPEKLEELNKPRQEDITRKRDYKKFPDGEGPPPDPAYNFLADAERDGKVIHKMDNKNDKKDSRQNNSGKNKDQQAYKRGGPNNSFRGRSGGSNNGNGKNHSPKSQKRNSQPEYEQWRNERERIDEARINRQRIGDGKWKREWDNDKMNAENEALLRPEKITLGDAFNNPAVKKSPAHNMGKVIRQNSGHNFVNTDLLVEKRGNITVSVSQTGEVKSVKLTSAPAIGTGRVGPRQVSKPQFSIQAVEREIPVQSPLSPRLQNKNLLKNNGVDNSITSQKVPNKIGVNGNNVLVASPNANFLKNKKDKKHISKQSFSQVNQIVRAAGQSNNQTHPSVQPIKSVQPANQYQPQAIQQIQQLIQANNALQKIQSCQLAQGPSEQSNKTVEQTVVTAKDVQSIQPTVDVQQQLSFQLQQSSASQAVLSSVTNFNTVMPASLPLLGDLSINQIKPSSVSPASASEIIPIVVDLSHKPEFAKKSIQDRLLRVRQTNQSNGANTTPTNPPVNNKTEENIEKNSIGDGKTINCDKPSNENIPSVETIVCN